MGAGHPVARLLASETERLGTRFFRATNAVTNEIAGTGLGVRIVQTIIDKHAGRLLIDSTEGEGTTVTIHLPAGAVPATPDDEAAAAPAEPPATAGPVADRVSVPSSEGPTGPSDDELLAAVEPRRRRD